ncbi:MAG: GH3 auxin-responsive promoter family protein, partial [Myxococcota bacterium]|nr:GH3 auxin-responsive promoter family protein [Myxococcota bacterium]
TEAEQKAFLRAADAGMMSINMEYKAKRESMRLEQPVLRVMREGWYERDKRARVEAGMRAFQAKTELLSMASEQKSPPASEVVTELSMD